MLLRLFFPSYFRWWLMKNFWFRINLFLHFLSLPRKVIKQTNQASLRDFFNFQCRQVLTLTTKAKERLWTPSVNGNWSNYLCFLFFLKSSVSWEKLLEENKTFYIPSIFLDLCLFIISPFSFLEFWSVWMIREKFSILLPQFLPLAPPYWKIRFIVKNWTVILKFAVWNRLKAILDVFAASLIIFTEKKFVVYTKREVKRSLKWCSFHFFGEGCYVIKW